MTIGAGAAWAHEWDDDRGDDEGAQPIPLRPEQDRRPPVDLRALVVEHRVDLFRFARSLTFSDADAEDLAQSAVLRALSARTEINDPDKAKAYLMRIVRNLAIDQARSRSRVRVEPMAIVPDTATGEPEPEARLVREADRAVPRRALHALEPAHRQVLELRFVEELDYATVAERLQTTEHAARQRVYRAMQVMRSLVRRSDLDDE